MGWFKALAACLPRHSSSSSASASPSPPRRSCSSSFALALRQRQRQRQRQQQPNSVANSCCERMSMAPRNRSKAIQTAAGAVATADASGSGSGAGKSKLKRKSKSKRKLLACLQNSEMLPANLEEMGEGSRQRKGTTSEEDSADEDSGGSSDRDRGGGECGICKNVEPKEPFITNCGHEFCRSCVVDHVVGLTSNLTRTSIFVKALMWILCPNPSCNEELVQQDLINLIGLPAVRDYERWMANYYDILYKPVASKASSMVCLSANCDQQVTSAILADRISDLSTVEVKHALDVRGLSFPNCTKRSCVKLLLSNIGGDPKHTDALWVCTTCEAAWCGDCGVRMPLNILQSKTHNASHLFCDRQRKYPIYKAIHDLKKAWHYYTSGSENLDKRPSTGAGKILSQTIWADGTGFGGDRTENKSHIHSMQKAAKKAESNFDGQVENAMDILIDALDHSEKATVADSSLSLSSATCALINWDDTLRQVLCHLATNDSMLDISERRNIYLKMAALIKILASYSELVPLLTEGLSSQVASSETTDDLGKGIENTTSSSLMTKMENIYKQATIMLHNMEAESSDPRANVDINLAKELCSCYEALAEALKTSGVAQSQEVASSSSSGHNSGFLESLLPSLKYKETLKLLQFKLVSIIDGNGEYRHYFKKEIVGQVEGSTSIDRGGVHNHKRTLHISKEIASLSTTLPLEWESSIHLCVDEERMDVLKALIIGPCGTPYQNGIFIFDMFLPPDYPQVPPKVRFLTTGGGRVRFNPNLYESGVVCLSLLGTWNGPGWVAGKSTLLQVLVSIQSLIFVKDPYYNEPGFERVETPQAEIENMRHRKNTLSYAILAALRKPDTFFEEIIFEHFRLKKTEIEVQCDQWVASASEADRSGMAFVAKQIKAELQALDS